VFTQIKIFATGLLQRNIRTFCTLATKGTTIYIYTEKNMKIPTIKLQRVLVRFRISDFVEIVQKGIAWLNDHRFNHNASGTHRSNPRIPL